MVFDCGMDLLKSETKRAFLQERVRDYVASLGEHDKVHLLILSHLHEDHTSGLDYLLSLCKVDTVIMPYITPQERLFIALEKPDYDLEYYSFLADPVRWLLERNVKNIILLEGNDEIKEERDEHNSRNPEDQQETPFSSPPDVIDDIKRGLQDSQELNELFLKLESKETGKKVRCIAFKKAMNYFSIQSVWEMGLFVQSISEQKLESFTKCIEHQTNYGKSNIKITDLIDSKGARSKLKNCYKKITTDLNLTSLCMVHGPARGLKVYERNSENDSNSIWCAPHLLYKEPTNCHAQLLTGDISFLVSGMYAQLKKNLNSFCGDIGYVQVPHHGSQRNWNEDILNFLPGAHTWLLPSGYGNRFEHPSAHVVASIIESGRRAIRIDEYSRFSIEQVVFANKKALTKQQKSEAKE